MKARRTLIGQEGFTLLEVLVAAMILGIALVGLTLLLSRGQAFLVAQGDARIALYLAEQKIERLRGLGFGAAWVPNTGHLNYSDASANDGCANPGVNNEPCYNETIQAGAGQQAPGGVTTLDTQTFTRLTCVRWVQDDNPELPADVLEPPASWTCPSCDATQPNCTKNTKRIKVAVIPRLLGNANPNTAVDPERVTLETVLTPTARP
jgi:prepilin-type N-terminal cleavage/methylation domain-containing protein